MVSFTIQNVMIAVGEDYTTVDIQIVDGAIAAISPNLQVIIATLVSSRRTPLMAGVTRLFLFSSLHYLNLRKSD